MEALFYIGYGFDNFFQYKIAFQQSLKLYNQHQPFYIMKTVIGIDVGISTTKIVGIRDGKIISPIRIKATDPVTSLYGAFGKYINENNLTLGDIEQVMLTGVGAAYIKGDIYGLPTARTDEFVADGLGAQYESGLDRMLVVSMGTGTTLVKYDNGEVHHIGGLGIGGGTLAGLSRLLLGTDDIKHVSSLAKNGNISNIDLQIGDICAEEIPGLPAFATASLFGNAKAHGKVRGHSVRHHLFCCADNRLGGNPCIYQQWNQGFCDDRKSHSPATVQKGVWDYGTDLWRAVSYTETF